MVRTRMRNWSLDWCQNAFPDNPYLCCSKNATERYISRFLVLLPKQFIQGSWKQAAIHQVHDLRQRYLHSSGSRLLQACIADWNSLWTTTHWKCCELYTCSHSSPTHFSISLPLMVQYAGASSYSSQSRLESTGRWRIVTLIKMI